jgi:hypothetical protein
MIGAQRAVRPNKTAAPFVVATTGHTARRSTFTTLKEEMSMGTWSHESFSNDTALDWALRLANTDDFHLIESTLRVVLRAKSKASLSETAGLEAIAAAEAIARLQGNFDKPSKDVDQWVARVRLKPSKALCRKARGALDRILTPPSELLEGWVNPVIFRAWKKSVRALKRRVRL